MRTLSAEQADMTRANAAVTIERDGIGQAASPARYVFEHVLCILLRHERIARWKSELMQCLLCLRLGFERHGQQSIAAGRASQIREFAQFN